MAATSAARNTNPTWCRSVVGRRGCVVAEWGDGGSWIRFRRTLVLVVSGRGGVGVAGIDSPELRESYELCARVSQRGLGPVWGARDLLPAEVRPHAMALSGFAVWTDGIADDGGLADRDRVLARWCADTLAEVRAGRSEHPLRRAFVRTMRQWELDIQVLEEFLEATRADSAAPPAFVTVVDQRRYLRGVAGTIGELLTPLLGSRAREATRLMSRLGEVCQLADILQDFPIDLAAGRCYLPGEDLDRLGLDIGDLRSGEQSDALDALIDIQVARTRELLEESVPAAGKVGTSGQPFVHAVILGVETQLHEVEGLRSRVLVDGLATERLIESVLRPRREPPAHLSMPAHVAVILDGNRRWATQRGLSAPEGHGAGMRAVLRLIISALQLGIPHLSVYGFSTENWSRSPEELAGLFEAVTEGTTRTTQWLHERGVRVRWCGHRDRLEETVASALAFVESLTSNNSRLTLNVFVDYGGRDELVAAIRALAVEAVAGTVRPEDIGPEDIVRHFYAPDLPDVDLLIRTSGEQRTSNFLPWHLAYAEFVFDPTYWPDFGYQHLLAALTEYSGRQRRFGGDDADLVGPQGPATTTSPNLTSRSNAAHSAERCM
jgi:undecaprenyl diphosphate synthase